MTYDDDEIVFETTGRKEYANHGIIGIDDFLFVSEGYDGSIGRKEDFTMEERAELGTFMISRWTAFMAGEK